jgi:hypothetical protein
MSDEPMAPVDLSDEEIRSTLHDLVTMTSARRELAPVVDGLVSSIRRDPLAEDAPERAAELGQVLSGPRATEGRAAAGRVRLVAAADVPEVGSRS